MWKPLLAAAILAGLAGAGAAQEMDPAAQDCYKASDTYVSRMTFEMRTVGPLRVALAIGAIDTQATERFNAFLRTAGRVDEIWFDSPGGITGEGIELGTAIRTAGLPVRVPSSFRCISACSIAFLGGPFRTLDPLSNYGVHASRTEGFLVHYSQDSTGESRAARFNALSRNEQRNQQIGAALQNYASRMGISSRFVEQYMLAQAAISAEKQGEKVSLVGHMRCMTIGDARAMNVVTE